MSPLWIRLIYWPGTLSASAVVAAAGVWALPWAARARRTLVGWVLVVTLLALLTYPPVGGLLLIAALVHLRERSWREVVLVAVTFLAGFGIATGVVFVLNTLAFDRLGVEIAAVAPAQRPLEPARPAGQRGPSAPAVRRSSSGRSAGRVSSGSSPSAWGSPMPACGRRS